MSDHVTEDPDRMTQDDWDIAHQNESVENYMTLEFVAIPPDFDIMNYLSLREQAGIFSTKNINLKHLQIIAEGVKASPVFSMLNNIRIKPVTCMYFLKIIHELDLVLKTLYNPMRNQMDRYLEGFEERGSAYIKGQHAKTVNFTIVNIFPLMNEEVISEAMTIAGQVQEYQTEVDKTLKNLKAI